MPLDCTARTMMVNRRAFEGSSGLSTHQTRSRDARSLAIDAAAATGRRARPGVLDRAGARRSACRGHRRARSRVHRAGARGHGGREVNPAGVQLGESDRLVSRLAQPLLLDVSRRHRRDCRPPARVGPAQVCPAERRSRTRRLVPLPDAVDRFVCGWVSASVVPLAVVGRGGVRLEGHRRRACRCSRGRRPSGSDIGARDRRATLPQRHPSGVGGQLIRTRLRRACRPQRPCSLPLGSGLVLLVLVADSRRQ